MFDKLFKKERVCDLQFNDVIKRFVVTDREIVNCSDVVIFSCTDKDALEKIADGINDWLSKQTIVDNKYYFVVTGEYPNLAISEKLYVYKDNYRYCLKDIGVNHIDLYENNKVFKTYEAANNEVIKLLQRKDSFTVPKNFAGNLVISDAPYISVELENKKTKRSTKTGK